MGVIFERLLLLVLFFPEKGKTDVVAIVLLLEEIVLSGETLKELFLNLLEEAVEVAKDGRVRKTPIFYQGWLCNMRSLLDEVSWSFRVIVGFINSYISTAQTAIILASLSWERSLA